MVNELATNAIKYAFPHGAGRIKLGFQRRDGEVTLTVEDNGIGMSTVDIGAGLGSRFLDASRCS
jgi:two-component sensor histidine kinase